MTEQSIRRWLSPLDQVMVEARPDGSTAKSTYDPAGNPTDACFWQVGISVGDCYPAGTASWTDPPSQVTSSGYDARNSRVSLTDGTSGTTTTYAPDHNYAISEFYVPTGSGHELRTKYEYDNRHRLTDVSHVLCDSHACTSSTDLGSDGYAYDDNDNRITVAEDNGNSSAARFYCYDALDRLTGRTSASGCSGTPSESYTYDAAGNRTAMDLGGSITNYDYDSADGQLACIFTTSCGTPNVTYDTAGRTAAYGGWLYEYDAEGRLVTACKSSSCGGSIDKVEFAYDGEGHRTQIKEYTAGSLTKTIDFRYQGDAIVAEQTDQGFSREYVVDEQGTIIRFCDPDCASPTASYLVTWNGHGDALAAWQIESDGTLTLANSYTYDSWGTPTTTVESGFSDLHFRFLYVGAQDVQWDDFSGLGLYYMHARHYSPVIGRFLQPDPARAEANPYGYVGDNPVTAVDPSGLIALFGAGGCVWMCAIGWGYALGSPDAPGFRLSPTAGLLAGLFSRRTVNIGRLARPSFASEQTRFGRAEPRRIYSARVLIRQREARDLYHNFPHSFDAAIYRGVTERLSKNQIMYTRRGFINGTPGTFEIVVNVSRSQRNEVVVHRFFRPD